MEITHRVFRFARSFSSAGVAHTVLEHWREGNKAIQPYAEVPRSGTPFNFRIGILHLFQFLMEFAIQKYAPHERLKLIVLFREAPGVRPNRESISRGMVLEGKIALGITKWNVNDQNRLENLLKKVSLPTQLPSDMDVDNIINTMKLDKKVRKGEIEMALPDSIGSMFMNNNNYGIKVSEQDIKLVLEKDKN